MYPEKEEILEYLVNRLLASSRFLDARSRLIVRIKWWNEGTAHGACPSIKRARDGACCAQVRLSPVHIYSVTLGRV